MMQQVVGVFVPSKEGSRMMKINVLNKLENQGAAPAQPNKLVKTYIMKGGKLVPIDVVEAKVPTPTVATTAKATDKQTKNREGGLRSKTSGLKVKKVSNTARKSMPNPDTAREPVPETSTAPMSNISKKTGSGFHSRKKSTMKAKASLTKKNWQRESGYMAYTEEDMEKAIELVHEGMPVQDAAVRCGIPRASLFNRSRAGCKSHKGRCSEVHGHKTAYIGSKKRKHMQYSGESVEKAIDAVHKGMPVIEAAILFKIPRASLFIRSAKGCSTHNGRCSTVYSNGQIHRTKVSKYKYRELMEISDSGPPEDLLNASNISQDNPSSSAKSRSTRKSVKKRGKEVTTASAQLVKPGSQSFSMFDPASGKVIHIPVKVVKIENNAEESPQIDEDISEHEFETLTTSDSKAVLKRLKKGSSS